MTLAPVVLISDMEQQERPNEKDGNIAYKKQIVREELLLPLIFGKDQDSVSLSPVWKPERCS